MDRDLYNVKKTIIIISNLSVSHCQYEVKKDAVVVTAKAGLLNNNKELVHFAGGQAEDKGSRNS